MNPLLTAAGLQNLATKLDMDLVTVMQSGAPLVLKQQIQNLVTQITNVLLPAAAAGDPVQIEGWGPLFEQLNAELQQALGAVPSGACLYSFTDTMGVTRDACIQATTDQCRALGGTPQAGPCPQADGSEN
jgi:hypothetical protein